MLKEITYAALLLLLTSFRGDEFTIVKSIPVKADFITTDNLGNCYAVRGNILEKYDNKGNLKREGTFKNSNENGEWKVYEDSLLIKTVIFKDGVTVKEIPVKK